MSNSNIIKESPTVVGIGMGGGQSSNGAGQLTMDMQHTVTAFYQHLNDKKPTHVNEID